MEMVCMKELCLFVKNLLYLEFFLYCMFVNIIESGIVNIKESGIFESVLYYRQGVEDKLLVSVVDIDFFFFLKEMFKEI